MIRLTSHITITNSSSSVQNFYNYGRIETSGTGSLDTTTIGANDGFKNIYNYGYISSYVYLSQTESGITNITNYGTMGGVNKVGGNNKTIIVDNRGIMNPATDFHFNTALIIKNYAMIIDESAGSFNSFAGKPMNNSHLVVSNNNIAFADGSAKMILDFDKNFELDKAYSLDKLVIDTNGSNKLNVDFSRLTTRNDIYTITKSGTNGFKVELKPQYSTIGTLYKSNIKTMNDFDLQSNNIIYPHKYKYKRFGANSVNLKANQSANLNNNPNNNNHRVRLSNLFKNPHNLDSLDSLDSQDLALLQTNEYFFYSNKYLNNDNIDNPCGLHKCIYLHKPQIHTESKNIESKIESKPNIEPKVESKVKTIESTPKQPQPAKAESTLQEPYYFALSPFISHNYFFESGRYNLSGLEYGFITAFSGKLNESNTLGTHFMFSYGNLNDKDDLAFNIKSMNLNVGLNYKLDLIYSMYLKVRIDGYYFLNEVQNTMTSGKTIKPNSIGFGASVSYGKEWDFMDYGLLGFEVGVDYKGLYASETTLKDGYGYSDTYKSALYNMLYVDLGLNYDKYFSSKVGLWGLNTGLGVKANATANKLAKGKVTLKNIQNNIRNIDMTLDNDLVLAYLNIGGSYVLNTKDFDMEFSIAYYGNYGNRTMSNAGSFEWRVGW